MIRRYQTQDISHSMLVPPSLELVGLSVLSLVDVNVFRLPGIRVSFIRNKCCVPVRLHCTAFSFKLYVCGSYIFYHFLTIIYVCSAGDLKNLISAVSFLFS
jgi:hypothetical protein